MSGVIVNFGWALARPGRTIPIDGSTIDVYVDNILVGHPTYNNFRADIAALFPGLRTPTARSGYFILDTRTLSNGVHTIVWIIRDDAGQASGVGSRYLPGAERIMKHDKRDTFESRAALRRSLGAGDVGRDGRSAAPHTRLRRGRRCCRTPS